MLKKSLIALVVASGVVVPGPASASTTDDTPTCVTPEEYLYERDKGMTRYKIKRVFGGNPPDQLEITSRERYGAHLWVGYRFCNSQGEQGSIELHYDLKNDRWVHSGVTILPVYDWLELER